ncbi:glycosyltransferase [Geodermatophilus maliterrae]|uniref:Glycosyltransferase n=1 Tax=Geodermatophilus maliterrae TaxID=3162531 RepID=A0ABV3XFY6_9ACTN
MTERPVPPPPAAGSLADVELVVVAYRSRAQIEQMLAGLPTDLPLVVVDNSDGADGLEEVVLARPGGRYLRGGGVGFARAANLGARTSSAEHLVFVNPDTRPTTSDLATLVEDVATDPRCSASGGTLVEDDGRSQIGVGGWEPSVRRAAVHALGLHKPFPRAGIYARPVIGEPEELDWVSGGCMAVRRQTFLDLGCFDEDFYVYNEDVAFGRASRRGGLVPRLRTDVPIAGSSGGSGAPSLEMMRLRGASMAQYLRKFHPRFRAEVMVVLFGLGYAIRSAVQVLRRDRRRAREFWAHAVGTFTGRAFVGGRLVTSRT